MTVPSLAPAIPPLATRVGQYKTDSNVLAALHGAAAETGTSFDVLLASAAAESGLRPGAKAAGSSASGMFQFIEQTWLEALRQYGPAHGLAAEAAAVVSRNGRLTVDDPQLRRHILDLRQDPRVSALLAGDSLHAIAGRLGAVLGRAPDVAETYLGHFLGAGGAVQMLQAARATPGRPAADLLPQAAQANPQMFAGPDGKPLSVAQFIDKVRARLAHAYAELGSAMPQGGITASAAPSRADPPEAGATGWGSGSPNASHVTGAPERMMLNTLAEVFVRVDRGLTRPASRQHRASSLPASMLQALQQA